MIYVVGIMDGKYIKIGYSLSSDTFKRIDSLQTGCPFEISEIAKCEGTIKQEKTLHYMLDRTLSRINLPHPPNEWYPGNHPIIKEVVDSISKYGFDMAYRFLCHYQEEVRQGKKGKVIKCTKKWPTK